MSVIYGDLKGREHPFWTKIKALKKAKKLVLDITFLEKSLEKEAKQLMNIMGHIIKEVEEGKYGR